MPVPEGDFPDALILAAMKRAEIHSRHDRPGVLYSTVIDHLGLPRHSGTGRKLRPRFREMEATSLIVRMKPVSHKLYTPTRKGQRLLKGTGDVELPESPQHRNWREAKAAATRHIQGFREDIQALLRDGAILLSDDATNSEAWYALAARIAGACERLGSATHCLREWAEPSDDAPDTDPGPNVGRRIMRYWDLLDD
jgi:hypothetical protein